MKAKKKKREEKMLTVHVEKELLDKFILLCGLKRVTQKDQCEDLIREFVKKEIAIEYQKVIQKLKVGIA